MQVLISSCLFGNNVRWNKQNKLNEDLLDWAEENGIELIPVCPEDELLGTPRGKIRLIQIEDRVCADYRGQDIAEELRDKCDQIILRYPEAVGFIGIYGSPTCGISVGVKNLGRVIKGFMHQQSNYPTVESNALRNDRNQKIFIRRLNEFEKR